MANMIRPILLDKTLKEILAQMTGEEAQKSASLINSPALDETGKAILAAIMNSGGLLPPVGENDIGATLTVGSDGKPAWVGGHGPVTSTIYGFRIDSSVSDPDNCVTYLESAVGVAPAGMADGVWSYGGWENAFFMPRPCMLKYDGTVDYYLDPNDYSKKEDGSASDVANLAYGGNAMMEWGRDGQKIWYKIVPEDEVPSQGGNEEAQNVNLLAASSGGDESGGDGETAEAGNTSASVYIANTQVDEDYHAWSFINNAGDLVDHFYTPIYNGSLDSDGKLRSMSGVTYENYCKGKTAAQEIAAAMENNPSGTNMWHIETFADVTLIQLLTVLITKSLDAQSKIGVGCCQLDNPGESSMLTTGSMDDKGLFWGGDNTVGVKSFGMENFWGNQMRRYAGLVFDSGYKYKLTYGTEDGSSASGYNLDGEGYLASGYGANNFDGFIEKQSFNGNAMFPTVPYTGEDENWSGSYCSYAFAWPALGGGVSFAYRGGPVDAAAAVCGLFSLWLDSPASYSLWALGAAPSCKPLSPRGGSGGEASPTVDDGGSEGSPGGGNK